MASEGQQQKTSNNAGRRAGQGQLQAQWARWAGMVARKQATTKLGRESVCPVEQERRKSRKHTRRHTARVHNESSRAGRPQKLWPNGAQRLTSKPAHGKRAAIDKSRNAGKRQGQWQTGVTRSQNKPHSASHAENELK